jgi:AraC family transcriptional regulator
MIAPQRSRATPRLSRFRAVAFRHIVGVPRVDLRDDTSPPDALSNFESRRLLDLSIGLVDDVRCAGVQQRVGPDYVCSQYEIYLPYQGLFVLHVGEEHVVGDTNQIVFARRGDSLRISRRVTEGFAAILLTPTVDVLREIAHLSGRTLTKHSAFTRRSWRAGLRLQRVRTRLLHWLSGASEVDIVHAEELVLFLLRSALVDQPPPPRPCGASTARLLQHTKEYLTAEFTNRVRLPDVARAVGSSPAYLTDLFRQMEGVSLHRYLTHLRLGRALVDLPHTSNITALALDLGFSSHSHFSSVFRRAFAITPSQFRDSTRRARLPAKDFDSDPPTGDAQNQQWR